MNVSKLDLIVGSVLRVMCEGVMADPCVKRWDNRFGVSGLDELHSIQATSDGGYILGGLSDSCSDGDKTEHSKRR